MEAITVLWRAKDRLMGEGSGRMNSSYCKTRVAAGLLAASLWAGAAVSAEAAGGPAPATTGSGEHLSAIGAAHERSADAALSRALPYAASAVGASADAAFEPLRIVAVGDSLTVG